MLYFRCNIYNVDYTEVVMCNHNYKIKIINNRETRRLLVIAITHLEIVGDISSFRRLFVLHDAVQSFKVEIIKGTCYKQTLHVVKDLLSVSYLYLWWAARYAISWTMKSTPGTFPTSPAHSVYLNVSLYMLSLTTLGVPDIRK